MADQELDYTQQEWYPTWLKSEFSAAPEEFWNKWGMHPYPNMPKPIIEYEVTCSHVSDGKDISVEHICDVVRITLCADCDIRRTVFSKWHFNMFANTGEMVKKVGVVVVDGEELPIRKVEHGD